MCSKCCSIKERQQKGLSLNAGHGENAVNFPTVNPDTTYTRQILTLKRIEHDGANN